MARNSVDQNYAVERVIVMEFKKTLEYMEKNGKKVLEELLAERKRMQDFKVGDWIVIDHYGDIWTTRIKEIKNDIVIKPELDIHIDDDRWYHMSRIRKATNNEIENAFKA